MSVAAWVRAFCVSWGKIPKNDLFFSRITPAFITPTTDAISMMFMLIPLFIFYEVGIVVAWIFGKKKEEKVEDTEEIFE